MNKFKIAKSVSGITNPPIICIPLFLIICATLSYTSGVFNFQKFFILEIVSLVFASLLPLAIILFWAKRLGTDRDISNRSDRHMPLLIGILSYFIGFLICLFLNLDYFLTVLLLCYSINTGVVLIITTKWKISVHTTALSGPVAALILLSGPFGAVFGVVYPILIWSRVLLKKHTLSQAICGGVQGFFLTVLEMHLFNTLFNFQIPMLGLPDSILYILAIITTPVILGFLSYTSKSRRLFVILEVIALAVFAFLPLNVFLIFVLVSLTSILISYFAGSDFVWNEIIC